MPVAPKTTVEEFAKRATAELQPAVTFNAAANVKQPVLPAPSPMPAPLEKALGINQYKA